MSRLSQAEQSVTPFVALEPMPLSTLREITTKFKRSQKTVRRWAEKGAPISREGGGYWADYWELSAWLTKQK